MLKLRGVIKPRIRVKLSTEFAKRLMTILKVYRTNYFYRRCRRPCIYKLLTTALVQSAKRCRGGKNRLPSRLTAIPRRPRDERPYLYCYVYA